jgi:outer membrane protein assembly factor BamB
MRSKPALAFLLLLLLMLAGCGGKGSGQPSLTPTVAPSQPASLYYALDQGPSVDPANLVALKGSDGKQRWSYNNGTDYIFSPVLDGDTVYAGTHHGILALSASDGKVRWRYQASGAGQAVKVVNGVVYGVFPIADSHNSYDQSTNYGEVFAINAASGKLLWRSGTIKGYLGRVSDGLVYLDDTFLNAQDDKHAVIALDAMNGSVRWHYQLSAPLLGVAVVDVADGQAYLRADTGTNQDALVVVNNSDGSVRWRFPQRGAAHVEESGTANGVVTVISDDGQGRGHFNVVYALNASNGQVLWRKQLQENSIDARLLNQGTLYLAYQSSLYALNASTGAITWHTKLQVFDSAFPVIPLTPTMVNGVLYFATFGQGVYAVNASDGSSKWRVQLSNVSYLQAIVNGVLYVSAEGDTITHTPDYLLALKSSDGSQVWKNQIGLAVGLFSASDIAVG